MYTFKYDDKSETFKVLKQKSVIIEKNKFIEIISNDVFKELDLLDEKNKIDWKNINDEITDGYPIHIVNSKEKIYQSVSLYNSKNKSIPKTFLMYTEERNLKDQLSEIIKSSIYLKEKVKLRRNLEINYSKDEMINYSINMFDDLISFWKKDVKPKINKRIGKIVKEFKIDDNRYFILINSKDWGFNIIYEVKLGINKNVYFSNINSENCGDLTLDCPNELIISSDSYSHKSKSWKKKII